MTTTTRRLAASILIPLAVGGTLAGCGSSDSASSSSASSNASPTSGRAVDEAFVRQMVPHHEGAIAMAKTAQRRATHAEIKTLAANVIASQTTEITTMDAVAKDLGVTPDGGSGSSMAGPSMIKDAKTLGLDMDDMGMSMDMSSLSDADPFDLAFVNDMIPHHEGAVRMAKAELSRGSDARLKTLATAIVSAQEREIASMKTWRTAWYGKDAASGTTGMGGHMNGDDMGGMH